MNKETRKWVYVSPLTPASGFPASDSAVHTDRPELLAALLPSCLLAVDYCSHMAVVCFSFQQSQAVHELRRSQGDKAHEVFVLPEGARLARLPRHFCCALWIRALPQNFLQ